MSISDPFRKIRCPFCSEQYHLGECAIYSENDGSLIQAAPQGSVQRFFSHIRVKSLEGRKLTLARALRQCPNLKCGKLLPFNIEYVDENITIAVIGDSFSGKSHFIAAAIKQVKDGRVPPQLGLAGFTASVTGIEARYQTDYFNPLFKYNEPLPLTQTATNPLSDPLIYEMNISGKRINLLIYDASGEDMALIDTRVQNKPHILNAQAMIFLADPWSIPGFVNQLAHHLRPEARFITGRRATDILSGVIRVFKRASNQVRETQFSLPIAIVLSKSDLIPFVKTRSGDPRYQALADPQFPGLLNRSESNGIHAVVRNFLMEVGESALVSMEQTLERVNFSAISATGASLNSSGKYSQVEPHRCLDPLFWVLRELEIVE
jgi:hypothetical protein